MNEYFFQNLLPRLECLTAQVKKLQENQKQFPHLEINIESTNCDELITNLQKIYSAFSGGTNLKISVNLKELSE